MPARNGWTAKPPLERLATLEAEYAGDRTAFLARLTALGSAVEHVLDVLELLEQTLSEDATRKLGPHVEEARRTLSASW